MGPHESTTHGPAHTKGGNDPKLNELLDNMRDAGMKVTNTWKRLWHTAIKYAWGQHYEGWSLKDDWDYVVVNRIYPLMFQTIAKLAGNDPKIMTHAWDDEKEGTTEYAERWAGHLDYLWKSPYELNMRAKLIMGLLDCAIFGYMVGEPHWESKPRGGWDPKNKKWVGKTSMRFAHPAHFWTDPSAETIDDAENCGIMRRVKMEWAQNKWSEYKTEIKEESFTSSDQRYYAGETISYEDQKDLETNRKRRNYFSKMVDLVLRGSGFSGEMSRDSDESDQRYVNVEKIFWRDYSEKSVKIEDPVPVKDLTQQGAVKVEEVTGLILDTKTDEPLEDYPKQVIDEYKEPQFPNGRFVFRIGQTILNVKEKDQVYTESRWPFIVMPYNILPHMWQGGNAVEMGRNSNDVLNMTISTLLQQVRRTADPTKIIEAGALAVDREGKTRSKKNDVTGLGRIVIATRGKIERMRDWIHPPLGPEVIQLAATIKQNVDDSMFMQDVARGAVTPGKQTATEIARLDRNSETYTALQAIFLDKFIDDTMTLIAEIAQNNYDLGRLMKILQDEDKQSTKVSQELLDIRFDVNIEPGSTLPFDEQKKQLEYKAAYDILGDPLPNPILEEMLRILNIPKRKEILEKHQGLQLFRQFIQLGQLLTEALNDPEAGEEIQGIMQKMASIPGMQKLMELLMKAGQLAPQVGK